MYINKKGFTLIEMVVTIMLLAIIVLIAFPSINGILDKNKQNNCDSLKRSITEAVKLYVSDNRYNIGWKKEYLDCDENVYNYYVTTDDECYVYTNNKNSTITTDTIKDYLKKDITNPCDSDEKVNTEDITIKVYRYKDMSMSYEVNLNSDKFNCCTSE